MIFLNRLFFIVVFFVKMPEILFGFLFGMEIMSLFGLIFNFVCIFLFGRLAKVSWRRVEFNLFRFVRFTLLFTVDKSGILFFSLWWRSPSFGKCLRFISFFIKGLFLFLAFNWRMERFWKEFWRIKFGWMRLLDLFVKAHSISLVDSFLFKWAFHQINVLKLSFWPFFWVDNWLMNFFYFWVDFFGKIRKFKLFFWTSWCFSCWITFYIAYKNIFPAWVWINCVGCVEWVFFYL